MAAADPDPQVLRFNESFYRSDPADYLQTRLELLMLAGGRRQELADLLAAGVDYAGAHIGPGPQADVDPVDPTFAAFLTIESQQLLHHACETALRLYLVHASDSDVPWVELSSMRSPSQFKEAVKAEFVNGTPDQEVVAYVCLGGRNPPVGTAAEEWGAAIDGVTCFLQTFAKSFLDDAPLYNSIKHGLGVSAGDAVALLDSHHLGGGPSVEFPEPGDWQPDDTRTWSLTTRWIDIGESLAIVQIAVQVIRSMWKIGRFRALGGDSVGELFYPVELRPADLRQPGRLPMRRMSWQILEERRQPRRSTR